MGDYKIDFVAKNERSGKVIDRFNNLNPEEAVFIIDGKYSSFNSCKPSKNFKQILIVNVDEFFNVYRNFFDFRKNKR